MTEKVLAERRAPHGAPNNPTPTALAWQLRKTDEGKNANYGMIFCALHICRQRTVGKIYAIFYCPAASHSSSARRLSALRARRPVLTLPAPTSPHGLHVLASTWQPAERTFKAIKKKGSPDTSPLVRGLEKASPAKGAHSKALPCQGGGASHLGRRCKCSSQVQTPCHPLDSRAQHSKMQIQITQGASPPMCKI